MVTTAPNPYQSYLKTSIETASQPQLLVMLFDAAVKKLRIARKAITEKNIELAHNELIKVQRIFSELMVALDFDLGGELAQQLFAIYDFVYRQLVQANIRRDPKLIDEVLPIVEDLREGWTKAVAKYQEETKEAGSPSRPQPAAPKEKASPETKTEEKAGSAPTQPNRLSTVSPAQYAKSHSRTYTSSTPATDDAPPQRLNLRG
ncbi:MAG: flagellar export chaperone FliS [bacterium]